MDRNGTLDRLRSLQPTCRREQQEYDPLERKPRANATRPHPWHTQARNGFVSRSTHERPVCDPNPLGAAAFFNQRVSLHQRLSRSSNKRDPTLNLVGMTGGKPSMAHGGTPLPLCKVVACASFHAGHR
eukprot:scaffold461_cov321-Pavlova_lutheri.AAC.6